MSLIRKYPLDVTGKNPNNLVLQEPHDLVETPTNDYRVAVPNYGGFFTNTFKVFDDSFTELIPNVDYVATYLFQDATELTGLEVCGAVVIKNPNVSQRIYIDYQVVGGNYAMSTDALSQVLESLAIENQVVEWAGIIGKPTEFPVGGHLHALWELYGFEYLVIQLERVTQAILAGDQATLDEIREYARTLFEEGKAYTDALDSRFQAHANNQLNPHNVTKAQVGLGLVQNYGIATNQEIETGTSTSKYLHVAGVVHAINHHIGIDFNNHLADLSNPHQVTKTQVGLGNVENFGISSLSQAQQGTAADRYMTPERTKDAITFQVKNAFDDHVTNVSNPHNVTKTQVGLGNVSNFPVASLSEAQLGDRSDRYMTAERVGDAVLYQAVTPLNNHMADLGNPHQVTKAQVGLGSVQNFSLASVSEAKSGASNTRYMTPSLTKEAISEQALIPLDAHSRRTDNPHNVTKAQVGLGSVQNYAVASTTEAEAGSRNDRYMTPFLTKAAITEQAGSLLAAHVNNNSNPHNVTKSQVGLGSVLNYGIASLSEARDGTVNTKYMTPLRTKDAIDVQALAILNTHASRTNNPHSVTKSQVGLGNVENYGIASWTDMQNGTRNDRYVTPQRYREGFAATWEWFATDGFTVPKSNDRARIRFPAGRNSNDPGYIEHIDIPNTVGQAGGTGTSYFRFSVSDDFDNPYNDTDRFQFGAEGSGGFNSWVEINRERLWAKSDIYVEGNVNANNCYFRSDMRFKEYVADIVDVFDKVNKLNGFDYRLTSNGEMYTGLSAQDVQGVLPHSVRTAKDKDGNDYLTVNVSGPIALLVETCKELIKRDEENTVRMKSLEERLLKLEKTDG